MGIVVGVLGLLVSAGAAGQQQRESKKARRESERRAKQAEARERQLITEGETEERQLRERDAARQRQRRRALASFGGRETVLTSPLGVPRPTPGGGGGKTLLGT